MTSTNEELEKDMQNFIPSVKKVLMIAIEKDQKHVYARNLSVYEITGICRSLMMDCTYKGSFLKTPNPTKKGQTNEKHLL